MGRTRFRTTGFGLLACVLAAGWSLAASDVSGSTASSAALPSTGRYLQRFAPTYMTPTTTYTLAEAVQIATEFDVIAAHDGQFNAYIAQMKAANPNIVILDYFNGSFAQSNQGTLYPESWYARDSSGNKITSTNFGNYLMDIGLKAWSDNVSSKCAGYLASAPFDGCFLDMLGDALFFGSYLSAIPINPATGAPWTLQERMDATTAIAQDVVNGNPGALIQANGLKAGYRYFDPTVPTSELFNGAPSALAETWIRQATRPINYYESEAAWKQDVDMLTDAATRGRSIAVTTKVWISATQAQMDQWHAFSLASFLLGTQGTAYYAFLAPKTPAGFVANYAWDHLAVGSPLNTYSKGAGVYRRNFSNALVVVNPTSLSHSITVHHNCTTLGGVVILNGALMTLGPETGEICMYS